MSGETLWPLPLGFALTSAIQAFISTDQMRAKFGDDRLLAWLVRRTTAGCPLVARASP
ncbi:MAG: hypothetical protein ACYCPT_13715 [Acidimicrobiales bacterium]